MRKLFPSRIKYSKLVNSFTQLEDKVPGMIPKELNSKLITAIKLILLCFSLLISVLIHMKAIIIQQPFLAILITTLILFNLPGFLFISLIKKSLPISERMGLSFSIGVCIQLIIAAGGLYFQITLDLLNKLAFIPTVLLGCYFLIKLVRNLSRDNVIYVHFKSFPTTIKENYFSFIALGLLILALILFMSTEKFLFPLYWERAHDDRLQFMPYVNQYLKTNQLDPHGTIYNRLDVRFATVSWLPLVALISKISFVDHFNMYVVYLPIIVWLYSIVAFFLFSKYLFKRLDAALLAVLIQLIYWASTMSLDIQQRAQAGYIAFYMNLEDRCFAYLVLIPIALMFFIDYQEKQEKTTLVVFTLFTLGLTAINPLGIVFLGLIVSSFMLFYFIVNLKFREFRLVNFWNEFKSMIARYYGLFISLLLPLPYLFYQRAEFIAGGSLSFSPENTLEDINFLIDKLSEGRHILYFDNITKYMVKPTLIYHPMIILSLFMLFVILFFIKKNQSALFIFSSYLLPLILLFNPWTSPVMGKLLGQQQLWRFRWIFPIPLAIAWVLYQSARYITTKKQLGSSYETVIILFFSVVLFFTQIPEIKKGINYLETEQEYIWENAGWLHESMRDALLKLDELIPPSRERSMVLVDSYVARFVHTFSARARAVEYGEDLEIIGLNRIDARNEVSSILTKKWLDPTVIAYMKDHNVAYILQRTDYPLNRQFELMPQMFEKIYNNHHFNLYFVHYDRVPNYTLIGNGFISINQWQEALQEYNFAINENSSDIAAYIGKGTALINLGKWDEAITFYQNAVDLSDFPDILQFISEQINIDSNYIVNYLKEGTSYNSPESSNTAYDFISHLENSRISSSDNALNVQSSVIILDRQPIGVLFQHPPSQVSFELDIPANGWFQFSPVLAPDVWQPGKGDGVQFKIELETQNNVKYLIYDNYLDPKNIVSQRTLTTKSINLAPWSGQTVKILFTTGCGPNHDCRFDWAGWAEPRIIQPIAIDFMSEFKNATQITTEERQIMTDTLTINNEQRAIIYQHPTSRLIFPAKLPDNSELVFGFGMDTQVWSPANGDGVEYNIYVQNTAEPGVLHRVFHDYIDPKNNPDDRRWFDERVDLSQFGGLSVEIVFEALPGPAGNFDFDWGGWSHPILLDVSQNSVNDIS